MSTKRTPTTERSVRRSAGLGSNDAPYDGYRPKLARVNNNSLYMKVYDELHQALMSGVFRPGEPVTLRQLIMRLGTSAMPARQAVGRLIAEGALNLLPNRSVIVPPMSRERFTELWRLRQLLEGMAAENACRLAGPKLAKRLKQINASIRKGQADGDLVSVLQNNQRFHFAIYDMADMTILRSLISILWLQAGPFLYLTLMSRRALWNLQRHTEAIKAFEAATRWRRATPSKGTSRQHSNRF